MPAGIPPQLLCAVQSPVQPPATKEPGPVAPVLVPCLTWSLARMLAWWGRAARESASRVRLSARRPGFPRNAMRMAPGMTRRAQVETPARNGACACSSPNTPMPKRLRQRSRERREQLWLMRAPLRRRHVRFREMPAHRDFLHRRPELSRDSGRRRQLAITTKLMTQIRHIPSMPSGSTSRL